MKVTIRNIFGDGGVFDIERFSITLYYNKEFEIFFKCVPDDVIVFKLSELGFRPSSWHKLGYQIDPANLSHFSS